MKKSILILLLLVFKINAYSQSGNALNFDGTDDGIDLNAALFSTTDGNQPYTIEAWIKAPSQEDNCIVCQYTFPGENRFQFEIRNDKLNWWKGYASTNISILSSASITDDQWHHVAATKDASGNVILYIDGVQDGTGVDNLPCVNYNSTIGERIPTNAGHFNGNIDDVRIWDIARTQTAIQSTMNQELVGNESGLIAYYNFNQGTAEGDNAGETTLNDGTSNGNDGTLTDFALIGSTSNWVGSTAPLPVELIYFTGRREDRNIKLEWVTASELNNFGFEIQKSINGRDWQLIDFIEGRGTTTDVNEYEYQDFNPNIGINYFRLKQFDFDGVFEFSEVIAVEYKASEKQMNVYPNPSNRNVNIQIRNLFKERTKITISDNLGMKVWESKLIINESNWNEEIEIEKNGMYFITAQIGNEVFYEQLVILNEE